MMELLCTLNAKNGQFSFGSDWELAWCNQGSLLVERVAGG